MKITPQEVYLYLARAAALVKLERHAEALEDREQAVKLAPESAEVYLARGGSYHQLGRAREGFGGSQQGDRTGSAASRSLVRARQRLLSAGRLRQGRV